MPDQPIPPLDALQAQLRGAIDQQLAAVKQHYDEEIAAARRDAAAEAERQLAARLDSVRAEWTRKLEGDVAAARKEGERAGLETAAAQAREQIEEAVAQTRQQIDRLTAQKQQELEQSVAAARAQAQQEAEQAVAAAKAQAQQEAEQAVAAARTQAQQEAEQAVAAARTQAQQEAEQAVAAARAQVQQEAEQAVAAAKAQVQQEAEQAVGAARAQAQQEAEQAIAAATAQAQQQADEAAAAKRTAELELESERRRSQTELESERTRLQQQIDDTKRRAEQDVAAAKQQLGAELEAAKTAAARAAETSTAPAAAPGLSPDRIVTALQNIDSGTTLSQALDALLRHVSSAAGRAAIFSINGDRLKAWKSAEIPEVDVQPVESSIDGRDLLARAIQSGQLTRSGAALPSPPFARLAPDRDAAAVPLLVGGRPIAVVYADNGGAQPRPFDAWSPAIDVFARHASAVLGLITATRTVELMSGNGGPHEDGDDQAARRYARLLISEIKLYNEGAVRVGRQQRDLLQRLRSEIDRARHMYEERVPSDVGARALYFQQELVQTLADGDPSLLGNA